MSDYKTFEDLTFAQHPNYPWKRQARIEFPNGFGVSVVIQMDYDSYELAVTREGKVYYATEITSDVIRNQTSDEITDLMIQVQKLESILQTAGAFGPG